MPSCSVKCCGARRSKNRPQLSLHTFPTNEGLRRKWIDAIGKENINPRHKRVLICSLHFEHTQINRTLDVTRLMEDAVSSCFYVPFKNTDTDVSQGTSCSTSKPSCSKLSTMLLKNTDTDVSQGTSCSTSKPSCSKLNTMIPTTSVLCETVNLKLLELWDNSRETGKTRTTSVMCETVNMKPSDLTDNSRETGKIITSMESLRKICVGQRKKIKRLNAKLHRQDKKIKTLKDVVAELQNKNLISTEQSALLENCAGPREFLKRQFAKSTKTRGGLVYASSDVIQILNKCENIIHHHLHVKGKPENYFLCIFKFLLEYYGKIFLH